MRIVIDWNRIDELRHDFGEEDFIEILDEFLDEVQAKLASLDAAQGQQLVEHFHFLKGSAANLGFQAFQAACGTAEQDPDPKRISEIRALFEASKTEFTQRVDASA